MHYPYRLRTIKPIRVTVDEDGDTHAVYDLPAPKPWEFTDWIGDWDSDNVVPTYRTVAVTRVRVCIWADEWNERGASVIPQDEHGNESPANALHFPGAITIVGVLARMGFAPILALN